LFLSTITVGERLYDLQYRFIGTVQSISNNNALTLTGNALISMSGGYIVATSTPTDYGFEIRDMDVGMVEKSRTWEIVDESIERYVVSIRPTFQFSSPYLRRSASGSYDITDVRAELRNSSKRVYVLLPDIQSDPVQVVSATDALSVKVQRQIIKPECDFACVAKSPLQAEPAWFKSTKNKPGYFL
jgi:hypothetical protein